jgi:hypothetical protein
VYALANHRRGLVPSKVGGSRPKPLHLR